MARFRHEEIGKAPPGWKVVTVTRGSHRVRIACPRGPRVPDACRTVSILHPKREGNPCGFRYLVNPAELLIMGANPHRPRRPNPSTLGRQIAQMKDRGASTREVGRMLSRATRNPNLPQRHRGRRERNPFRVYMRRDRGAWKLDSGWWGRREEAERHAAYLRSQGWQASVKRASLNPLAETILGGAVGGATAATVAHHIGKRIRNPRMKLRPGDSLTFHGHDGKDYAVTVITLKRGFAEIQYFVPGTGQVKALVPRAEWRKRFAAANPRSSFGDRATVLREAQQKANETGRTVYVGRYRSGSRSYGFRFDSPYPAGSGFDTVKAIHPRNPHGGDLFTGEKALRTTERRLRKAARSVPASDPDRQRATALYRRMMERPDDPGGLRHEIATINARRGWSMSLVSLWARGGGRGNPAQGWHDMTAAQYRRGKVTSVAGGSTWIRAGKRLSYVAAETPIEIRRIFESDPKATIRVQVMRGNPSRRFTPSEVLLIKRKGFSGDHMLVDATGHYFLTGTIPQLEKAAKEMGYRVRVDNPAGETAAREMYRTFHGRGAKEILELQEPDAGGRTLTSLGTLKELTIKPVEGRAWVRLDYSGNGVKAACNSEGSQIYFLGGRQQLTARQLADFGTDTSKELIELGECVAIVYRASKSFTDFQATDWEHHFGEEGGRRPIAGYDADRERIFLVGGDYRIEAPGIIN